MMKVIPSFRSMVWGLLGLFALSLAVIANIFIGESNLHRVEAFQVYRAAQFNAHEWQEALERKHFKTFLNLRGANPQQDWYIEERNLTATYGIRHIDFKLSAKRQPTLAQMDELVSLMLAAQKPLLIHCRQGVDRTGLVSALYAYAIMGQPAAVAEEHLSLRYGHFRWFNRTRAMRAAFDVYVNARPQPVKVAAPGAAAKAVARTTPAG